MQGSIGINGGEADALVNTEPLALLLAMLLDQQIPMEWAFMGPLQLRERLGRPLDAREIAAVDPAVLIGLFRQKPALHRFPQAMGARAFALCTALAEQYDGDAERIWQTAGDAREVYQRLRRLPGFGDEKAKILLAILAKRCGVRPAGWERVAHPFTDDVPRSVADIDGPEALERVRAWKKAQRQRGLGKQD
jgi:uncharacterized HhH-GPD family protein